MSEGADEAPRLGATAAVVVEVVRFEPLFEKLPDTPLYPASTTKIMTALLVLERGELNTKVAIRAGDAGGGGRVIPVRPGKALSRRELLTGLLMASGNNLANVLARDHAGGTEEFARRMTLRAEELGARSSRFANASGLFDEGHYCSVRDMALITREALRHEAFREIIGTARFLWRGGGEPVELENTHRLLGAVPGLVGGKTGFLERSGRTLVSVCRRGGVELIAVVFGSTEEAIWDETVALLDYGFARMGREVEGWRKTGD